MTLSQEGLSRWKEAIDNETEFESFKGFEQLRPFMTNGQKQQLDEILVARPIALALAKIQINFEPHQSAEAIELHKNILLQAVANSTNLTNDNNKLVNNLKAKKIEEINLASQTQAEIVTARETVATIETIEELNVIPDINILPHQITPASEMMETVDIPDKPSTAPLTGRLLNPSANQTISIPDPFFGQKQQKLEAQEEQIKKQEEQQKAQSDQVILNDGEQLYQASSTTKYNLDPPHELNRPMELNSPSSLSNISMMVLGGFIATVGVATVALAFILLNAATLGIAGLVVAGVGATMALTRLGLFATGASRSCQTTEPDPLLGLWAPSS